MNAEATTTNVRRLARAYGVSPAYVGDDDTVREPDVEVLLAVLQALGAECPTADEASAALERRRRQIAQRVCEPVIAVHENQASVTTITIPDALDRDDLNFSIEREDGEVLIDAATWIPESASHFDVLGEGYAALSLRLAPLPLGYHRLLVNVRRDSAHPWCTSLIISAPSCPRATRGWG